MPSSAITIPIVAIAVGAILKFAVTASVAGIDIGTVGVIMMVVGIVGLVVGLGLVVGGGGSTDRST